MKKSAAILFAIATILSRSFAETGPAGLPFEDPVSLLSIEGDGVESEFFARGFWEAEFLWSGTIGLGDSGGANIAAPLFKNRPDFFLYYLLNRQWYLEASVKEDILADSTFALGYLGKRGEYLREVRVGNAGIDFPSYPFVGAGTGVSGSFGISVNAGDERSAVDAVVRYDRARRGEQSYLGNRQLSERRILPNEYVTRRFFEAPAGSDPAALYVDADSGPYLGSDGRRYRLVLASEYVYSALSGRIELRTALDYDRFLFVKGGGDLTIDSTGCARLYPPLAPSGAVATNRQVLNRYSATGVPEGASIAVISNATGEPLSDYSVVFVGDGTMEVRKEGGTGLQIRFPFKDEGGADASSWIYDLSSVDADDDPDDGTNANADKDRPDFPVSIRLRAVSGEGDIRLPAGVEAGGIEVRRNGVPDTGFSFDPASGLVTLSPEPGPSDRIDVSYLLPSDDWSDGVFAAALGGSYAFSEEWSAWTAFGCRWGVPGSGFTEPGTASPGTMTLAAGTKAKDADLSFDGALALDYRRDDATGLFRLEGMENDGAWKSPFMPSSGSAKTVPDAKLEEAFPGAMRRFHPGYEDQEAAELTLDAGTFEASRHYDPVPVRSYRRLSFFAKADQPVTSFEIGLGDGTEDAVRIALALPGDGVWRKYTMIYGDGDLRAVSRESESAGETAVPAAVIGYDPSIDARVLLISAPVAAAPGTKIWLDEIHLEESAGSFAGTGAASFAGSWKDAAFGSVFGMPLVTAPRTALSARGGFGAESLFGAFSAEGSIGVGPFDLGARTDLAYSNGSGSAGFGHLVALVRAPVVGFEERFSSGLDNDGFYRKDSMKIDVAERASLSASAEAKHADGLFTQSWRFDAAAGDRIAAFGLEANGFVPLEDPGLENGYASAWIGSFRFLVPAFEDEARSRASRARLAVLERFGFLSANAAASAEPFAPSTKAEATVELGWEFKPGILSIRPWYRRSWGETASSAGASYVDDASRWFDGVSDSGELWAGAPFAEFFDVHATDAFAEATAGSDRGRYVAETGLTAKRPAGSSWSDLFVPSELSCSFGRRLERGFSTVTDSWTYAGSASSMALNLFGALGAYPAFGFYQSDEFSSRLSVAGAFDRDDGSSVVAVSNALRAAFHASPGAALVCENRFEFATRPDGQTYFERAALSWTTAPGSFWLASLASLLIDRGRPADSADSAEASADGRPDAEDSSGEPKSGASYVSAFLDDLATRERFPARELGVSVSLSRDDPFGTSGKLEFRERYEARFTIPDRLFLSAFASLAQSLVKSAGTEIFSVGFELGVKARITF